MLTDRNVTMEKSTNSYKQFKTHNSLQDPLAEIDKNVYEL